MARGDPLIVFLKDLSQIARLRARLAQLSDASPHAGPLMVSYMKIIVEDNRRGVLAGLDKDGRRLAPVTYRPRVRGVVRPGHRGATLDVFQRNTANMRLRIGTFHGLGLHASGVHNNLTRKEYEKLGGPPLAPRRGFSRVITNLKTGWQRINPKVWEAYGYWDEVVSTESVPFLHAHFTGAATGRGHRVHLPTRDLRGVRPDGVATARKALIAWMKDVLRSVLHG
jgi:hypothetical protein